MDRLTNEWWTSEFPLLTKSNKVSVLWERQLSFRQESIYSKSLCRTKNQTIFNIGAVKGCCCNWKYQSCCSLQLLANLEDYCQVAKVAKEIVANGWFSQINEKVVTLDKALFLLDLVGVGRRIYTKLRQTLIPETITFPSNSKVAELRNTLISRPSIHLYPDSQRLIGVSTSYFHQVRQTLERILSTIDLPAW